MFKKILIILGMSLFLVGAKEEVKNHKISLEKDKFSVLTGQVSTRSVAPIIQEILLSDSKSHIIYIDSPGGSVFAGNDLIRAMKASGKEITCVADVAISMAFAIFQQCDNRYVTENSVLMQHLISYGSRGTHRHNASQSRFADQLAKQLQLADATAIGVSVDKFVDQVRDDWWFYGKNAIDEGAAEGLATVTCSKELVKQRIAKKQRTMFFVIKYEISGCPLLRGPLEKEVKKQKGKEKVEPTKEQQKELDYFLASLTSTDFIAKIKMNLMRPRLWF